MPSFPENLPRKLIDYQVYTNDPQVQREAAKCLGTISLLNLKPETEKMWHSIMLWWQSWAAKKKCPTKASIVMTLPFHSCIQLVRIWAEGGSPTTRPLKPQIPGTIASEFDSSYLSYTTGQTRTSRFGIGSTRFSQYHLDFCSKYGTPEIIDYRNTNSVVFKSNHCLLIVLIHYARILQLNTTLCSPQ